ncbi:MAG: 30S ribosomal protein S20 [bacterium]
MSRNKSAMKRIRQSEKERMRNRHYKSTMKTAIKSVLSSNDKESAEKQLKHTVSLLDKMVAKGIIHRNKAANQKSRLTKFVNTM